MLYDKPSGGLPLHLRLPMPTLRQLASHPESEISDEVRAAVLGHAANSDGEVDPYWVHARTHQTHRDVTIGQVAQILLAAELG